MVRLMKFFAYSAFFISMLMYFMPKISTYYLFEEQLKENSVVISKEELIDNGFSLDINNACVSVNSISSAKIKNINIKLFAFFNEVSIQNISLSKSMNLFIPLHVEHINISYSLLNPLILNLDGVGEFGEFVAKYDISEHKIKLHLKPSKVMLSDYETTLTNLKKSENGEYIYEKNI